MNSWKLSILIVIILPLYLFSSEIPPVTIDESVLYPKIIEKTIHPSVYLLDELGENVLNSSKPLSLMRTCGTCHNTKYIAENNYHAQVGLDEFFLMGNAKSGREWDISPGLFGRWDPLNYRTLTSKGFKTLDLGTADWIRLYAFLHAGGGPAQFSRYSGRLLTELEATDKDDPELLSLDENGEPKFWNWKESGVIELNCLLCHIPNPNNTERINIIKLGQFNLSSTATLVGTGIVEKSGENFVWIKEAFNRDGSVRSDLLKITDPENYNCLLCHAKNGKYDNPVIFENSSNNLMVETKGEIFSAEKISNSAMNLEGKENLNQPWDIHASRLLKCVNCHHSPNNPNYIDKGKSNLKHLNFDARRLRIRDYLLNPDHNFVKGETSQGTVAKNLSNSMRSCRVCHNAEAEHNFLEFKRVHFEKLSCTTCHIPKMYAPSRMSTDWTVLTYEKDPIIEYRGVDGEINKPTSLISGYYPILLLHNEENSKRVGPFNLITTWFWVEGKPERPVRLIDLEKAYFEDNGNYHPDIIKEFDANKDGKISKDELRLDSENKINIVKKRLILLSVDNPRIKGEIIPYSISHGVMDKRVAIKECIKCHGKNSILSREIKLSNYTPLNIEPNLIKDSNTYLIGDFIKRNKGELYFKTNVKLATIYTHCSSRLNLLDKIGIFFVLIVILGTFLHALIRIIISKKIIKLRN